MIEQFFCDKAITAMAAWSAVFISLGSFVWQWWRKYPKLKVTFDDAMPPIVFPYDQKLVLSNELETREEDLEDDGYGLSARCIIYVQLENHSETPITVTAATFVDDATKKIFRSNFRITGVKYSVTPRLAPYTVDLTKLQLKLPVLVPPYEMKYGYLLFPVIFTDETTGTLTLHSSAGDKQFKIKIITAKNCFIDSPKHFSKVVKR